MVINDLQCSNKIDEYVTRCSAYWITIDPIWPSCGDSDEEISENTFQRLIEKVKVPSVHGNHDNLEVLQELDILMKME